MIPSTPTTTVAPATDAGFRLSDAGGVAIAELLPGEPSLAEATRRSVAALEEARRRDVHHLVLDLRALALPVPSLAERLAIIRAWADAAAGRYVLAVVCRPELLDPDRFGVVAAAGYGLRGNAFDELDDAVAWLREQR